MTTKVIQQRINAIREMAGDDESAHAAEDSLYLEFIKYVASLGGVYSDLANKAKLLHQTQNIKFARWCA